MWMIPYKSVEDGCKDEDSRSQSPVHRVTSTLFPDFGPGSSSGASSPSAALEPAAPSLAVRCVRRWSHPVAGRPLVSPQRFVLWELQGTTPSARPWQQGSDHGLMILAECNQPLLLEIASYLDEPRDLVSFCSLASRSLERLGVGASCRLWEQLYARRWPAFYCYHKEQDIQNLRLALRDVVLGKVEVALEVFDREKKLGFAMAAMPAIVRFEATSKCYVAKYISASEVAPERIPLAEGYRLRFCPRSARPSLEPARSASVYEMGNALYPYKVLQGFDGLYVGGDVELQWKMQTGSPFGWWCGRLEDLRLDPGGRTALASITFRHFPTESRWYRLEVRFGDDTLRVCQFGGYTGGIRGVSAEESIHWKRFLPKDLVTF
eukprot:TRINITY_DN71352_c0_g1_i1.p1 TRINITY_DN71352_c0_g1~~TRINITY_DN71352_c0_g1_i1.p1  ORF type:complete len:378 (+),score=58.16 TRINITY_DN71352_c0_g1_i1:141-1274(+)